MRKSRLEKKQIWRASDSKQRSLERCAFVNSWICWIRKRRRRWLQNTQVSNKKRPTLPYSSFLPILLA